MSAPALRHDSELTRQAAKLAASLPGCGGLAQRVKVRWHPGLSSAAGRAHAGEWTILLNPRLPDFPGELDRTLRHELAHLVAFARVGTWRRNRMAPHGPEWRQACAELGIAGEARCHTLPLPRRRVNRRFAYQCPGCATVIRRVREIPRRRALACGLCCKRFTGGRFDPRFRLVPVLPEAQYPLAFSENA